MIAARGTTNLGKAWASSGQNQAYRKSLYKKVGGYSQIANKLQGDDSLFLQICRKQNSAKVIFADKLECRTMAREEKTWETFIKQRVRWSGDAKIMWQFNGSFFLLIIATFLLPLLLLVTFTAGIFHDLYYINIFAKIFIIHFIMEFILYFVGIRQLAKSMQFFDFCFWYLIHIPYVVMMGIGSFFIGQLSWRGRKTYPV
jgi:cellulose synthase/poly-beta-1,6-N-acetylglucosamine synthase-like glycosyltransferase